MRRRRRAAAAVLVAVAVAGCSGQAPAVNTTVAADPAGSAAFHGTLLIDPAVPRPALRLPDTSGRTFDLQAERAGVTALFFGYTSCPDLCPTTMADLAAARRQLPAGVREQLQVVFVAEDPARDTPAAVRAWLDRFDPAFIGLIGGGTSTAATLDALDLPRTEAHIDASEQGPHGHPYGDVDHSGVLYLFGPQDRATVVHTGGATPTQLAEDVQGLLG